MKCENCKKNIVDKDKACYARESNVYLCSLACLTNYAHEYLGCVPIESTLIPKKMDNESEKHD